MLTKYSYWKCVVIMKLIRVKPQYYNMQYPNEYAVALNSESCP